MYQLILSFLYTWSSTHLQTHIVKWGIEPPLPQMSAAPVKTIDVLRVAKVSPAKPFRDNTQLNASQTNETKQELNHVL